MNFKIIILTLLVEAALGLLRAYNVRVACYRLVHKANQSRRLVPFPLCIDRILTPAKGRGIDMESYGPRGRKVLVRGIFHIL